LNPPETIIRGFVVVEIGVFTYIVFANILITEAESLRDSKSYRFVVDIKEYAVSVDVFRRGASNAL
jgi:hypothetical protein